MKIRGDAVMDATTLWLAGLRRVTQRSPAKVRDNIGLWDGVPLGHGVMAGRGVIKCSAPTGLVF